MLIPFGMSVRSEDLGQASQICQKCRRECVHEFESRQTCVSLLHVLAFPIGEKQIASTCSVCGHVSTSVGNRSLVVFLTKACPYCARRISADATICGGCGQSLAKTSKRWWKLEG